MTHHGTPDVPPVPFARVLVPYDGSVQSDAALAFGIALARRGAGLDLLHVVDETPILAESSTTVVAFDPTPLVEALDAQGREMLDAAQARCRAAGVDARAQLLHELPVAGIAKVAEDNHDQLIVLGTHARSGLPRTFLGSTTEGVLRSSDVPVLAVHADMAPPTERLFTKILIAVDDSDPSEAAIVLAARLAHAPGTNAVVCSAFDAEDVLDKATVYGYDPKPFIDTMRKHAHEVVAHALEHGGFPPGAATSSIVEDEPARGIVAEAARIGVDLVVVGSHGRRGLRRMFLGSVAEHIVRHSPVPVLVVRSHLAPAAAG